MRQELIRVNNDNDRLEERLSALEANQAARAEQVAREGKSNPPTHPPLKVVHLEPTAEAVAEPESTPTTPSSLVTPESAAAKNQESSPRPMIKGTGQKVYSTHGGGAGSPSSSSPSDGSTKAPAAHGGS